jgi:hypothetical protein
MITPAPSARPFPDPNRRFTETPPVPLRNLQRNIDSELANRNDIDSEVANRNNRNRQSTVTPGLANQNQQAYKTKYEATLLRLQDLEEKYNGLLARHQAYLLIKASNPIDLTVRAINLPFVDGLKFDGFDVLKDSEKKQQKKVSAYFTMIMGEVFLMDTFVVRSLGK